MTAQLINSKEVSQQRLASVAQAVQERTAAGLRVPCLAVILVDDDPTSAVYVCNKKKTCLQAQIESLFYRPPASATQEESLQLVRQLNDDPKADGVLIQFPFPAHIDGQDILEHILPHKDVDGFHPYDVGRLAVKKPLLRPCIPEGMMTLLESYHIGPKGKKAVIVGVSSIVGRPQALEMLLARAATTVYHSTTENLAARVGATDILVVGVGIPNFVKGSWVKPRVAVIDVSVSRLEDGNLCGDVEFDIVKERASMITPVSGGVGSVTIATLLENTLEAAKPHGQNNYIINHLLEIEVA